jgi:hypothetical protein
LEESSAWKKHYDFIWTLVVKSNFFVCFLGALKKPIRHFKIIDLFTTYMRVWELLFAFLFSDPMFTWMLVGRSQQSKEAKGHSFITQKNALQPLTRWADLPGTVTTYDEIRLVQKCLFFKLSYVYYLISTYLLMNSVD